MSGAWAAALCVLLAAPAAAAADSWPAPQVREVFSPSRGWFVRVVPGQSVGDTVGFAGSPKGAYATAELYRRADDRSYRLEREFTLANPVAPVLVFVTNGGYLVTLDNWHNVGYGAIVVSYDADGRRRATYELKDLFRVSEIEAFTRSTSSIWWRTETAYVRSDERSIHVSLPGKGTELIVAPETGAWQVCTTRGGRYQCRVSRDGPWRPFRDP